MRPIVVLAFIGQPCSALSLSIDPETLGDGVTEADVTCDEVAFVQATQPEAICDDADVAYVGNTAHTSLQDAIDAATDGDVVHVCPGTHPGARLANRSLRIAGMSSDPTQTVIEPAGKRTLTVTGGTVAFEGLTVTGSGMKASDADVLLEGMRFDSNVHESGGALSFERGTLLVTDSTFTSNTLSGEGNGGALELRDGCFEIRDSHFEANEAGYSGGAVDVSADKAAPSTLGVWDTQFVENTAGYAGGAVTIGGWGQAKAAFWRTSFEVGHADYEGGAIATSGWETIEISVSTSTFERNTAGYMGGAIQSGGQGRAYLTVEDTDFDSNEAGYAGGAIGHSGWEEDGVRVEGSTFSGNRSPGGAAVAVGSWSPTHLVIEDSEFTNNLPDSSVRYGEKSPNPYDTTPIQPAVVHEQTPATKRNKGYVQLVDVDFLEEGTHLLTGCGEHVVGLATSLTCDKSRQRTP